MKNIIIYFIGHGNIYTSEGEKCNKPSFLDWLVQHEEKNTVHMFYHLDHAVANLCKMIELDDRELRKLWEDKRLYVRGLNCNYTLSYVPGKMFSIDKGAGIGKKYMIFGNMGQYMDNKVKECATANGIIEYPLQEAHKVAVEVVEAITEITGTEPNNLASPIRAYQKAVLEPLNLPTDSNVPMEVGKLAYACCKGGWTEALSQGQWDIVYDWDRNSSYPSDMLDLVDTRWGEWEECTGNINNVPDNAMGFYNCEVNITADFHPILYIDKNNKSFTPTGKWTTPLTLDEVRFIREWSLGTVQILDGWTFYPVGHPSHPLRNCTKRLYKYRQEHNGSIKGSVAKKILVASYGKFLEVQHINKKDMFGPMVNTVWAAQIETRTRLEVARFALEHGIVPLHIAVDGLVADRPILKESSDKIGEWKLSAEAPAMIVGSGVVALQGKVKEGDFSLDYDWIRQEIEKEPFAQWIEMENDSVITVGKAVMGCKNLGAVERGTRSIILNGDNKRFYVQEPESFGQMIGKHYRSTAWDISILEGIKA